VNVLVLGAAGMLGHTVLRSFAADPQYAVFGTVRSTRSAQSLPADLQQQLICSGDAQDIDGLHRVFDRVQPGLVINCVGVVKQLAGAGDVLTTLPINALLPHRLLKLCKAGGARLVHISTDCVFSGAKGMYREEDVADARDLYGISKLLGEVDDVGAVTLRTSIVGPELAGAHGLLGWFLGQRGRVKGFTRAIFSGLPTVELARVIREFVIPEKQLRGLYHVSSAPISKYELLRLVAPVYGMSIEIEPDPQLVIDRSLDSTRFRKLTGYQPPDWPELVRRMHHFG